MQQLPLGIRLADRAVFATFLPARNAEAVQHLREAAAGTPGATWLAGPAACGKSHLLQAVCAAAGERGPVGYFPLQQLAALGPGLLAGLTGLACLCLDDLQAVVGELEWERALFGVYRELEERGATLVAASSEPPALLAWALPDLGSRFAAAAIFQLRPLDDAGQCRALQLRARVRGLELPEQTARWLLLRFPRDMGTLYRLLDTLDEAAFAAQRRLTVPFIRSVLGSVPGSVPGEP
ncbi:MAG TPA: DnaA regulatory inactivator Hda [Steroidobacteraceae bacterium]|nr:DnaA regulatory inactivator Hda [Steroidobacteraceae bacterium]